MNTNASSKRWLMVAFTLLLATAHQTSTQSEMTFFLTGKGPGNGANLGGLAGTLLRNDQGINRIP